MIYLTVKEHQITEFLLKLNKLTIVPPFQKLSLNFQHSRQMELIFDKMLKDYPLEFPIISFYFGYFFNKEGYSFPFDKAILFIRLRLIRKGLKKIIISI